VSTEPSAHPDERTRDELERLRVRVEELERELAERTAKAEAAVAAAQDRSYWPDRLPVDLNRVMPTPLGRAGLAVLNVVVRGLRAVKRLLS
jgi:hypothetical protein